MSGNRVLVRDELYELVWKEPIAAIAGRLGISGVGLAKICKGMGIPVPGRGYWARKKAGQHLKRPPLPPRKAGESARHELSPWRRPEAEDFRPEVAEKVREEKVTEKRIVVPGQLRNPHPLIVAADPLLRNALKAGHPAAWDAECVDIFVTKDPIGRALRIMDALFKALEARGYRIEVTPASRSQYLSDRRQKPSTTGARLNGLFVTFGIEEEMDRVPRPMDPRKVADHLKIFGREPRPDVDRRPTGRLVLRIKNPERTLGAKHTWKDRGEKHLEDCLNDVVAAMLMNAEHRRLRDEEWARRDQARRDDEARIARREQMIADLNRRTEAWENVNRLRGLVVAVRARHEQKPEGLASGSAVDQWLQWVERMIANYETRALEGIEYP